MLNPLNKYKFYFSSKGETIAVATFAGKTVRGVARCSPEDAFDEEKGKQLAAARCHAKIAQLRRETAEKRFDIAKAEVDKVQHTMNQCFWYLMDSTEVENVAKRDLKRLTRAMRKQ